MVIDPTRAFPSQATSGNLYDILIFPFWLLHSNAYFQVNLHICAICSFNH